MIRRKIAEFMRGRYGSTGFDKLTLFLLVSSLAINIFRLFFSGFAVSAALYFVQLALWAFMIFRLVSRNFAARAKENRVFCSFWSRVKGFFKLQFTRIKDIGKYRYRKCPHCKAVLRLPASRGKHTVRCPKCSERFEVNNLI